MRWSEVVQCLTGYSSKPPWQGFYVIIFLRRLQLGLRPEVGINIRGVVVMGWENKHILGGDAGGILHSSAHASAQWFWNPEEIASE
jgi:hypothetical protein